MIETLLAALFGLLIGSFLNVVIHRWPNDLSVVQPRSKCPSCNQLIAWYDNIPVLSYLLLRGRCRDCHARILPRYLLVELLTGAFFAHFVWHFGISLEALRGCLLSAILIALIFTDLESRILPDELTLGGLVVGLMLACVLPVPDTTAHAMASMAGLDWNSRALSIAEAVLGALLPSGALWMAGVLYQKLRHVDGLGLGDVKMLAMIGAFLGLRPTLLTLIAGSVLGSVVGLIYLRWTKSDPATYALPLGTFLGIGGLAVLMYGRGAIDWYAGML